jgi:hypothetical protein
MTGGLERTRGGQAMTGGLERTGGGQAMAGGLDAAGKKIRTPPAIATSGTCAR